MDDILNSSVDEVWNSNKIPAFFFSNVYLTIINLRKVDLTVVLRRLGKKDSLIILNSWPVLLVIFNVGMQLSLSLPCHHSCI